MEGHLGSPAASSPGKKPLESPRGKQEEFQAYGKSEDISVLHKDIRDLKAQLQNANKIIQNLKSQVRSLSVTSDYSSSLERPRKLKAVGTLEGSSPHSVTDEDEGWLSDGTGAFYPPGLQAKKDLESLIQRVAQLPKTGVEGKLAEELRSASWPGKYDSLIQDQARELSNLRQKMREGRGICYLLTQDAKDTVKSFEDLLGSNDIDYYLGQSFREQLTQGSQLTERLTSKLSTSVSTVHPPSPAALPSNHLEATSSHYLNPAQPHSPLRGSTELGRILEPGYLGSGSQWDVMRPQKGSVSGNLSSGSSVCQLDSKPTGWLQGLTCWKNILVKSGTCVSGWRSPSALMTACGSSSNTGSAARPVGMVGEARAAHFCHDWGTSEGRALKLSFTLFKAPC
ncbi:myomegalin isoform X5 [Ursus maritimus]|uniref:Myomegalin isoform X5 n=1 Tax=Ursus maritimus TaxID=29073 RepID=A0A8M1H0B5_URSMA|nr:myomegalin isoform X5 [Ursus maritimus]